MFIFLIQLVICTEFDDDMRWGTYKPQLIHAISQRNLKTYNPITAALLYYNPNFTKIQDIVYKVPELDTENIKFKIHNHNGKNLNVQEINDPQRNVTIISKWIKFPKEAKINWVDQSEVITKSKVNVVYAFTIEQFNPSEFEDRYFNYTLYQNGIHIWTQNEDYTSIEGFFVNILINGTQPDYNKIQIIKLFQGYDVNWDARHGLFKFLKDNSKESEYPNLILINVNASLGSDVIIQIQQSSKFQPQEYFRDFDLLITTLQNRDRILFKRMFGNQNECARASLANLMQGLQFTYGDLLCTVKRENCIDRKGILTHTPSRLGFPRPFLWDEGFHNIVACRINPDNCLQSLIDWVNTMSSDGWIPREQPRNDELRSYIPFLYEDPRESNPPTFFFDFEYLLRNPKEEVIARIGLIYPKLKLWYQSWFKTQAVYENNQFTGNLKWWGPDERSNLGSGLDDWPRSHKDYVSKYNIDAQAWGYFFCQEMSRLATLYDPFFVDELEFRKNLIKLNTKIYMQDPNDGLFKDILYLKDQLNSEIFSPHRGYPNLIPIGLGMVDKSDVNTIKQYLKFMSDPQAIWTKYGLRSLEVTNEYFGVGSNYWRGPLWINIQYLVLRGLKTYYWDVEGVQDFYYKLRKALTDTVCNQYESRGYFYEHYNQDLDGQGKGNRPFSKILFFMLDGWTSLITMIISEQY